MSRVNLPPTLEQVIFDKEFQHLKLEFRLTQLETDFRPPYRDVYYTQFKIYAKDLYNLLLAREKTNQEQPKAGQDE